MKGVLNNQGIERMLGIRWPGYQRTMRLAIPAGLLAVTAILASCGNASPAEAPTPTTVLEAGMSLYQANCQSCHGGATGGTIADYPPKHNTVGHTWHHADCQLVDWVLNGKGPAEEETGARAMPAFTDKLSEEEVEAIITYIKTWWLPEQRSLQESATEGLC